MENTYRVKFNIERTVNAENKEDAEQRALEAILQWNWYYVHDYINLESVKQIKYQPD